MKIFDLYNANLDGTKLIEASAGTGKTFTLSGLYIRYIVEKKLMPEQILVLTFTKAATLELKTRLREQLIQCKNHLLGIEPVTQNATQLFKLYESYKQQDAAIKHIEYALLSFDQAAIYTINGFCQKIIDDYNSECGLVVFQELVVKIDYIKKYVYEFWRIQQKQIPIEFLSMTPPIDKVSGKLYTLLNKSHYQQVSPVVDWSNLEMLAWQKKKILKLWKESQDIVLDYMFAGCFGKKYAKVSYEKCRTAMNDFLASFVLPKTNFVERFSLDFLEKEGIKPVDIKVPKFITEFTPFYNYLIYSYGEKKSIGNNIAISYMHACFHYVQNKFAEIQLQEGKYDYSDQVKVAHQSICKNPNLANKIANQWQCVMVDEFQDTDNLQLEIFDTCFNNGTHDLIYVGDPKQAIYDFRGADVFVYNKAKESVKNQFNLATNWRSSDKMLAASNAMFEYKNSFEFAWLQFTPSRAKPNQDKQLNDIYPPVALLDCAIEQRQQLLANEIKRFVNTASINEEKIKPEKCAILVNANKEAIALYEYLLAQDVAVSLWSDASVFATEVANQLYYLLRALNYPSQSNLFTSLHGLFFNISLNDLQQLDLEKQIAEFVNYRLDMNQQNCALVLENILTDKNVYQQLLQRIDGERHLADLQHIIELLQEQIDQGSNQNQLEQWLATQIQQTQTMEHDEQRKRRIESDSNKIAIMTIHKSKGLEFDHVFIPYADKIMAKSSNTSINLQACLVTHDKNNNGKLYWRHSKTAQQSHNVEKQAEAMRNLYVAITRAKHRVYLGIDKSDKKYKTTPISKLLSMIENDDDMCAAVTNKPTKIHTQVLASNDVQLAKPLSFNRNLHTPQAIYSFSALSNRQNISFEINNEPTSEIDYSNYFQFPKGAKSGTMQHEILENLAFDADITTIQAEVKQQLKSNNYHAQWQPCLSQQIHKILNTELWKNGVTLAHLTSHVDEMEFMLPIGAINNTTISKWLSSHRNHDTVFTQDNLQGYLTGFIDLVFAHDNKYYVVDYKSNFLGSNFADYSTENLQHAIEHHYYDLQYLLYSVALVKHLQNKIVDFDYTTHFGGIAYIFTRGINGEPAQGIYYAVPDEKLINEMIGKFDAR
ncbi:MAG: UvrD-helicase domain-containing protein [Proteobacteria bacterium]|nr:UvrD-helicase domain-containing protein [Pseudomonadota bacterium]